jgi:hypothetical protein
MDGCIRKAVPVSLKLAITASFRLLEVLIKVSRSIAFPLILRTLR